MHQKRHHYIPELLLKQFCDESDLLHCYDLRRKDEAYFATDIGNVFVVGHLYSTLDADGTRSPAQEAEFSKLEGLATPVVTRILTSVRRGHLPNLDVDAKLTWNRFFYNQWRRVPALREKIGSKEAIRSAIESFVSQIEQVAPHRSDIRAAFSNDSFISRMHQNVHVGTLQTESATVLKLLSARGLAFGRVRSKRSFIIGSQPVLKLRGSDGGSDMRDDTVESWLPIAPDIAVSPGRYHDRELIVDIPDDWLRSFNESVCRQSTTIAGRSKALVMSLGRFLVR